MKCNHMWYSIHRLPFGCVYAACGTCGLGAQGYDSNDAIERFKNYEKAKEINMSEYKRGIEDATKPITKEDNPAIPFTQIYGTMSSDFIDNVLAERRKKLLSKKVTKWITLIRDFEQYNQTVTSVNPLANSKGEAEKKLKNYTKPVGVFPIEVEVPID